MADGEFRVFLSAVSSEFRSARNGCRTVICVIGKRSGANPTPAEAAAFARVRPDGIAQASYTQWEYFASWRGTTRRSACCRSRKTPTIPTRRRPAATACPTPATTAACTGPADPV
jgi:hypothetical protein